jgi:hypothetical protein
MVKLPGLDAFRTYKVKKKSYLTPLFFKYTYL